MSLRRTTKAQVSSCGSMLLLCSLLWLEDIKAVIEKTPRPYFNEEDIRLDKLSVDIRCMHTHRD